MQRVIVILGVLLLLKVPGSSSSLNGKRCFTCNDLQGKDCSKILSCQGDQDRCVSTSVEQEGIKVIAKACASKSMCAGGSQSRSVAGVTASMSCCEGDLCNSATSTAVRLLLLLVAPVVSVALFN